MIRFIAFASSADFYKHSKSYIIFLEYTRKET